MCDNIPAPSEKTQEEINANAEEFRQMIAPVKDSACDSIKTDKACHANTACSWCTSFAVPSSCNSVEDAKKLPAGVFMCDNIPAPSAEQTDDDICDAISAENSCDKNSKCTWCRSAAVGNSCNSIEAA